MDLTGCQILENIYDEDDQGNPFLADICGEIIYRIDSLFSRLDLYLYCDEVLYQKGNQYLLELGYDISYNEKPIVGSIGIDYHAIAELARCFSDNTKLISKKFDDHRVNIENITSVITVSTTIISTIDNDQVSSDHKVIFTILFNIQDTE